MAQARMESVGLVVMAVVLVVRRVAICGSSGVDISVMVMSCGAVAACLDSERGGHFFLRGSGSESRESGGWVAGGVEDIQAVVMVEGIMCVVWGGHIVISAIVRIGLSRALYAEGTFLWLDPISHHT